MHVDMKYTLASSLTNVNANVIPVRLIFLINNAFDAIREFKHILLFILSEIKERSHMTSGNNKGMPRRDREPIKKSN